MATDNTIFLPPISISEAATSTDGGAPPTEVKVVAGSDGSTIHTIKTDAAGVVQVSDANVPTVGQKTMAGSSPVVIASDQSAVPVSQSGTWDINDISGTISLPTGAATDTLQTSGNASLTSIDTKLTSQATAAAQSTGNASLASIDSKLTNPLPVSLASSPLPTGAATSALQTSSQVILSAISASDASIDGKIPTNGQKTSAASLPVVLASDQSTIAVAAAALPLPTGAATEATLATRASETTLAALNTKAVQQALGSQLQAASVAVTMASNQPAIAVTTPISTVANSTKGKIAGTALTGSYATVLSIGYTAKVLFIFNTCDQTILVSINGGSTDAFELEANDEVSIDLGTNGLQIVATTLIQAKHAGVTPTSGSIRVSAIG